MVTIDLSGKPPAPANDLPELVKEEDSSHSSKFLDLARSNQEDKSMSMSRNSGSTSSIASNDKMSVSSNVAILGL